MFCKIILDHENYEQQRSQVSEHLKQRIFWKKKKSKWHFEILGYFSKGLSFKLKNWYLKAFDTTFDTWTRFICKTFKMFEIVAKINATALCTALFGVIIFISIFAPFHRIWYIVLTFISASSLVRLITDTINWFLLEIKILFVRKLILNVCWNAIFVYFQQWADYIVFPFEIKTSYLICIYYLLVTIFDYQGKVIWIELQL